MQPIEEASGAVDSGCTLVVFLVKVSSALLQCIWFSPIDFKIKVVGVPS
jgi:hypothetical protein